MTGENALGIPWEPPDRILAVTQYLNRCAYKVRIATYHLREFERLEVELRGEDLFDFDGELFIPVQAHADGVVIQLSAAFDAFACAVAHQHGLADPDKADFAGWHARLVRSASPDLAQALKAVKAASEFAELSDYRNLAAHRGVIGEQMRGAQGPSGEDEVRLLLPDWLPEHFPDYPEAYVGPILRRYVDWGTEAVAYLRRTALSEWVNDWGEKLEVEDDPGESVIAFQGRNVDIAVASSIEVATPESLAPTFGAWKAWFSSGSHDFISGATDPPAWFVRRGEDEAMRLDAVQIDVEELRSWLQGRVGEGVAKAVLRWYRPKYEHGTAFGTLLVPGRNG